MNTDSLIHVAGHRGLVGNAIARALRSAGYENLLLRTSDELDLRDQSAVAALYEEHHPEYVFLAAARVGGIHANDTYRAQFLYDNIMIQANVLHQAHQHGVKKLLFLGSSCIYPRNVPQPMAEDSLLTGELEYTNEPYAVAKISGMKMCENYAAQYGDDFIAVMPTNVYGPHDNFDLDNGHVLAALIRKFHLASLLNENKQDEAYRDIARDTDDDPEQFLRRHGISAENVSLWGSGRPYREFLHVDDLAGASLFMMRHVSAAELRTTAGSERNTHVNIGTGRDLTIADLADLISRITGFTGTVTWDTSKPDGTPRKLLDISRARTLGWQPSITLEKGLQDAYRWYSTLQSQ